MTAPAAETTRYTLEPNHSSVEFAVKHMLIATSRGHFADYSVEAEIDESNLANSRATVRIQAASVDTRSPDRDAHLRSADFFDVENHPEITFVSKAIKAKGGSDYKITGDITIRGVSREITLDAELTGPVTDPWGGRRYGVSAHGKVNRKDFGIHWNAALDAGGFVLADDVKLSIEVELIKA